MPQSIRDIATQNVEWARRLEQLIERNAELEKQLTSANKQKTELQQNDLILAILQATAYITAHLVKQDLIDKTELIDGLTSLDAGLRNQERTGQSG